MGSKPRISVPTTAVGRLTRRLLNSNKRLIIRKPHVRRRGSTQTAAGSVVSDKLEALRNLVPPQDAEIIKPDQLFREAADYIVLLKTQVFVLQKLVDFYGSQPQQNRDAV